MKRVLFITTVSGTIRRFLLPFANHFRAKGWQVDAMSHGISDCPECTEAFNQVWDVSWTRNPFDLQTLFKAPQTIRETVSREKYDLIHVHTPIASFITRYSLRRVSEKIKPKVVYTAHGFHFYSGGNPLKNFLFSSLEGAAGKWTDYLVVINQEDKAAAQKHRIVPNSRIRFMPGIGVDNHFYNNARVDPKNGEEIRRQLGMRSADSLFLMVAEFNPGKRHRDALHAFARLGRQDAHLAFAGNGPLKSRMEDLAGRLNIKGRTHFLGFREDIPALMQASCAVLLPSQREGLPRSVMEALCLERPCIGSDSRGTRDLLTDDCGILTSVGDVPAMARAMGWVLDHRDEAMAMGRNGRLRMENFDIEIILRMHEELYGEALGI